MSKPIAAAIPALPPLSQIQDPATRRALQALADGWSVRNGRAGDGSERFLTEADVKKLSGSIFFSGMQQVASQQPGGGGAGGPGSTDGLSSEVKRLLEYLRKAPDVTKTLAHAQKTIDFLNAETNLSIQKIRTLGDGFLTERVERIAQDSALLSEIDAMKVTIAASSAAILEEQTVRATADSSLAQQITTLEAATNGSIAVIQTVNNAQATSIAAQADQIDALSATVDDNTAAILAEQTVRATADEAMATQITTVTATANNKSTLFAQSTPPTASRVNDAWIDTDNGNLLHFWSGSEWVPAADARIEQALAAVNTETTARVDGDAALASQITTVTTALDGNIATVQTHATAIDGIEAQYTIKVDANGRVAGIGLVSGPQASAFVVNADAFIVEIPGYPGVTPFYVGPLGAIGITNGALIGGTPASTVANNANTAAGRTVARPNLLTNGGFESGAAGWTNAAGGSGLTVSDGPWGRAATRGATTGTGVAYSDPIPVEPNEWYTISGDATLMATSGSAYFDLVFYNASGVAILDGPQNPQAASFDFSTSDANRAAMAVEAQAPATAAYCVARFVWANVVGGTAVGCRQVKVERGRLPYTVYSNEAGFIDVAQTLDGLATDFNSSNNRNGAAVTAPTVATDGTAVDHALQSDGSADISFEWSFAGIEGDIDGFLVHVRQSSSASAYTFGTTPAQEAVYAVPANKRAFILYGTAADQYYTWGVQAYRSVDKDVNAAGVVKSTLVKATLAGENPYRPSANVAFAGNVTGTVNGIAAGNVNNWPAISGTGRPADNATVGATIGVNLTGQMTAGNIGTWIANAAIGTALMQDASITNAKIGNLEVGGQKLAPPTTGSTFLNAGASTNISTGLSRAALASITGIALGGSPPSGYSPPIPVSRVTISSSGGSITIVNDSYYLINQWGDGYDDTYPATATVGYAFM